METWHAEYRRGIRTSSNSPSRNCRGSCGCSTVWDFSYDPHVLSTDEVYDLAAEFGRSAAYAVDAGYDGIHLSGRTWESSSSFSPFYNRRDDEFGGSPEARLEFLALVHDEIRDRAGDVP
ncbi:hypothetical protein D8S78_01290 [Natrialba swarupiae]|nr:hypothetical protein [Natrialba swarupiae]